MKTSAAPYLENMQPTCRVIFNIATSFFSFFLDLLLVINLTMCTRAFFTESATTLRLVEQAFRRMPSFAGWVIASSFDVILARPSIHSTTGACSSGTSGSRMKELGEGFGCVNFARFLISWQKLQLSPSEHCPLAFHCQQISKNSLYTLFCSLDSWPRRVFHNFHFWHHNSYFVCTARYFFKPSFSIFDNQVRSSSDESPGRKIPIRSWAYLTLVFLICTVLPRCHQVGLSS